MNILSDIFTSPHTHMMFSWWTDDDKQDENDSGNGSGDMPEDEVPDEPTEAPDNNNGDSLDD